MVSWLQKMCPALMILVVPFITASCYNPTDPISDISSSATLYWSRDLVDTSAGIYQVNLDKMLVVTPQGILTHVWDSGSLALALLTKDYGNKLWIRRYDIYYYGSLQPPMVFNDFFLVQSELLAISIKHKDVVWRLTKSSDSYLFSPYGGLEQFGRYLSWKNIDLIDTNAN
jgi:hypothetical protein